MNFARHQSLQTTQGYIRVVEDAERTRAAAEAMSR